MANGTLVTKILLLNGSKATWDQLATYVLAKGEPAVEFVDAPNSASGNVLSAVKVKIGDGYTRYKNLPYVGDEIATSLAAAVERIAALETTVASVGSEVWELTSDAELPTVGKDGSSPIKSGSVAIVKTLIDGEGESAHYSYTAYVHNGEKWCAMDGNYNASNVYFDDDFTFTKAIGTVTIPSSGSTVVDAQGKNLKEFFAALFAAEQNPQTTQPSVSFNSATSGAKEVGTKVTPTWNAKLNAGSYTYGPETGVTATSWEISNNSSDETATTASGSFAEITVTETTNYTITAKANYADGAMPKTNIGNDYAAGQIKAGSKSKTSNPITGYRAWFYGYKNGTNALATGEGNTIKDLDSADIRALTSQKGSFPAQIDTVDMKQIFFAAPAGEVTSVVVSDATNGAPQTVTKTSVDVEGANGYTATAYDVFYVSNAVAGTGSAKFNIVTTK